MWLGFSLVLCTTGLCFPLWCLHSWTGVPMWESLAAHGLHKTVRKIQGSKPQVTGGMTCVTCSFLKWSLVPGPHHNRSEGGAGGRLGHMPDSRAQHWCGCWGCSSRWLSRLLTRKKIPGRQKCPLTREGIQASTLLQTVWRWASYCSAKVPFHEDRDLSQASPSNTAPCIVEAPS